MRLVLLIGLVFVAKAIATETGFVFDGGARVLVIGCACYAALMDGVELITMVGR